ncbi:MAG: hypothetical protein GX675_03880 [Erysipelotrichaceae bacterium]|nr:hypothetical protein [Erysipelotrichaceae bacterium]
MNEIVYLIDQAERYFEKKQYEIGSGYYLDAWITLKEHMLENDITKSEDIFFASIKDTDFVKKWVNDFYIYANEENQFKTNIEILESMLNFLELSNEEFIIKNRALCDSYYHLKEYDISDKLYKRLIEKYPNVMEYYYGYGLTLYDREQFMNAITILEEGINKSKDLHDMYIQSAFEVILQIYENLNDIENIEIIKEKINKLRNLS